MCSEYVRLVRSETIVVDLLEKHLVKVPRETYNELLLSGKTDSEIYNLFKSCTESRDLKVLNVREFGNPSISSVISTF